MEPGCERALASARNAPWLRGCKDLVCTQAAGYYVVEGCGAVAFYTVDGRQAEADPRFYDDAFSERIGVLRVICITGPVKIAALESMGTGLRGEVYEASAPPYGRLHVKVMRALEGHDRESRVLLFLSKSGFMLAPRLVCSMLYKGSDYIVVSESVEGEPLAHVFVESARLSISEGPVVPPEALHLGMALAALHRTLGSCVEEWCRQRPSTRSDVERWLARVSKRAEIIRGIARGLHEDEARIVKEAADALEDLSEGLLKELATRVEGRPSMLIHGDMHLYQVFKLPGGRLVFTDFEGEPSKEPGDPMELEPPERDIAALARSVDYARALAYMAAKGSDAWEAATGSPRELGGWLNAVIKAVVRGYREAGGPGALGEPAIFWLVERASYEAVYELKYATGLHPIPLEAIIRMQEGSDDVAKALGADSQP